MYMLLIGEYSIKLLPARIHNTCVVLLCEPRTSRHGDGCRDFSAARTRPAEGDRRTRNDMNQWAQEWGAGCGWMCCWVGGRLGDGEGDGGPQRALLSSLQGLCSTELICCEMCKHCLDWCLVCTGDWKEEQGDGEVVEGIRGEAMSWNRIWKCEIPQRVRLLPAKPPCHPCIALSEPIPPPTHPPSKHKTNHQWAKVCTAYRHTSSLATLLYSLS